MASLLAELHRARQERLTTLQPSEVSRRRRRRWPPSWWSWSCVLSHQSRRAQRSFCFGAETFVVDERVGVSMGSKIWDGSIAMCDYLAKLDAAELEPRARVLELGAGVGLCSIVARRLFPHVGSVIVSDREENRELIVRNIAKNHMADADIRFQPVDWCAPESLAAFRK